MLSGVETSPGPGSGVGALDKKTNLSVSTYNFNGLGEINKLRRVLMKARCEINNGGIVLFQDTHIKDKSILKLYWKMNYASCCVSTRSVGVITLFYLLCLYVISGITTG